MLDWLWANVSQIAEALAIAGSVGTVVYSGVILLMSWLKKQLQAAIKSEVAPLGTSIAGLATGLASVQLEFKSNGGSSLRDQVMFTKAAVSSMLARQWALVDGLGDPMWEAEASGQWLRANRSMLALTQRPQEQILGTNWENTIHYEDRAKVWEEWTDAVARKRSFEMSFRVMSMTRSTYHVDAIANPVIDGGVVTGWLGKYRKVDAAT